MEIFAEIRLYVSQIHQNKTTDSKLLNLIS